MHIRSEEPADAAEISRVTTAAFHAHPHSDGSEPRIIQRLREAGALSLSLVAVEGAQVVGHVALSPVKLTSGHTGWFGLGPVSVLPARQGAGIGSSLVRKALEWLLAQQAMGCVVLGEPAYYSRFGFQPSARLELAGVPAAYFMELAFIQPAPHARVSYHRAFSRQS